jgi:ribosomal protein L29
MQQATGVVDNVRAARNARQDVARIKTIMNERKRAASATGSTKSQAKGKA